MEDWRDQLLKIGFMYNLGKLYKKYFYMFNINSLEFYYLILMHV